MKAKQRETLSIEEDNLQFFKAEDFSAQHNIQICENQTMLRICFLSLISSMEFSGFDDI